MTLTEEEKVILLAALKSALYSHWFSGGKDFLKRINDLREKIKNETSN